MAYEVTATRKRPQLFDQLKGQDFVVSTLAGSIDQGRIAHAYLFSGPRGVGKTSAARILARALNCEKGPTSHPCGECTSCREIARGNSLDVIEIDGASNTSVNDVREIKDEVLFAPNGSRYKVYIIDEVHMLSNSAFNALLKTIEEPPPYIVFIFATTEIHKVPATIRSRCQQFNFRLFAIDTIKRLLSEVCKESGVEAEDEALFWIAKEATGSMRDAYTMLDQIVSFAGGKITMELIAEKLGVVGMDATSELVEAIARGNAAEALAATGGILDRGISIEQLVTDLAEYFRSLLFIRQGINKEAILGYAPARFSPTALETFSVSQLEQALGILLNLYRDIRFSLSQRFELDLAVSRLASLGGYLTPGEILRRIDEIRAGGATLRTPAVEATSRAHLVQHNSTRIVQPQAATPEVSPPHAATSSGAPSRSAPIPPIADSSESDEDEAYEAEEEGEWDGEPRGAGLSPAAPVPDPYREDVIAMIRKTKLTLASTLEKALDWRINEGDLTITFNNGFSAKLVKDELATVVSALHEVSGKQLKVSIETAEEETSAPQKQDDERVALVKKIFRGEVIQGGDS